MMKKVLEAFIDRKRVVLTMLVLIFLYGYFAYKAIPRESFPDIDFPNIYVQVRYEGISPEDSERLLIKPIENTLKTIEGVKHITSYANESNASIILEFEAGFDSDKAVEDVRNKVDEAKSDLPEGADEPIVTEINLSLLPVLNIIVSGDFSYRTLRGIAEDLQDRIEGIPEILEARISGFAEEVVEIQIEPKFIETYQLSISDLRQAIDGNNRLITAGTLNTSTGDFAIKVPGLIENYQELLDFPIKVDGDIVLKVGDVATVKRKYKVPESIARVNGKNAVVVEVIKRTGENIISTIEKVKEAVELESEEWPENLEVLFSQDESDNIVDMVDNLENNIIIGVLLVLIVILLSVGIRAALLIAFSLPSAFLSGILLLYFGGVTLNIVVLFSLILTVGMIVDDAIVVSEYADGLMRRGLEPSKAYSNAAYRMLWPVINSTVVKIVVFMPLLFWPGLIGQFMRFMPITVIVVLFNSTLYALVFLPSLGILLKKPKEYTDTIRKSDFKTQKVLSEELKKISGIRLKYATILQKVLKRPKIFVWGVFGSLVGVYAFFIIAGPGSEFFPSIEPDNAFITVQSTDNLSIYAIDKKLKEIEGAIAGMEDDVRIAYTRSGKIKEDQFPQNTIGYILLEFHDWDKRRKAKYILADIEQKLKDIKGVGIQIIKEQEGPPTGKAVHLDISGRFMDRVDEIADNLLNYMKEDPDFIDFEDSRSIKEIEWKAEVDRTRMVTYGIDYESVGAYIRLLTNGFLVSTYRPADTDEEIDVVVIFPEQNRGLLGLDNINISAPVGPVPLSNIVKFHPQVKVSEIKRVDRKRVVTIMADVPEDVLANDKIAQIRNFLKDQKLIAYGVDVSFRGEQEDQEETANFLSNAFLTTLLLMFLVMLIQFNNFYHTAIIMSAVFLSSVGVILGHIITWQPFGVVMSGVGIIALGGIVLNNNILFIDTYQRHRAAGVKLYDAIVLAGVERLAPILLTAFTAVLGLMPMVIGLTINFYSRELLYDAPSSQWWRQLSASIAGGLSFATILTLFFTPCLLILGQRFDRKFEDVKHSK